MNVMEGLSPAEQARQLARPDGDLGRAVADWMNEANRPGYAALVAQLGLGAGAEILEIGPGNARQAADIVAVAPDVRYTGLDISPTMVAEAERINANLIAAGRAVFHLGAAEAMPFGPAAFDGVLSIGVMHFWPDPARALAEIRRMLRAGGVLVMGGLSPRSASETFSLENGFFLRSPEEWDGLCRAAGFGEVLALEPAATVVSPAGEPTTRYSILVRARA